MKFVNNEENTSLISRLDNIIKSNRVSHAYIFEGSPLHRPKGPLQKALQKVYCALSILEKTAENAVYAVK